MPTETIVRDWSTLDELNRNISGQFARAAPGDYANVTPYLWTGFKPNPEKPGTLTGDLLWRGFDRDPMQLWKDIEVSITISVDDGLVRILAAIRAGLKQLFQQAHEKREF